MLKQSIPLISLLALLFLCGCDEKAVPTPVTDPPEDLPREYPEQGYIDTH